MKRPNSKDKKYRLAYGGFNTALYLADEAEWDAEQRARSEARQHRGHVVKAVLEENGNTSNYYNGKAKDGSYQADGKGHSHIVADSDGNMPHTRDHGRH